MKNTLKRLICGFIAVLFIGIVAQAETNKKMEASTATTLAMASVGVAVPTSRRTGGALAKLRETYGANRVIARSYIRMEAYLVNGKAEYEFFHRLLGNEASTEHKLNDQDGFLITDIGIFLSTESTAIPGISVLQTYPNIQVFPDEVGFAQNAHFESIYNGFVTAKIGDTTWLPDLPIADCRVVNTTIQSATLTKSERHAGNGYIPCQPQYFLKGRENNSLKLVVPANSAQKLESNSGTTNTKHKVVMILAGFKVTGAGNTN